jgi:hypothetical protein
MRCIFYTVVKIQRIGLLRHFFFQCLLSKLPSRAKACGFSIFSISGRQPRYEELLRLKSARGRPHAQALAGLARCARAEGDAAAHGAAQTRCPAAATATSRHRPRRLSGGLLLLLLVMG